MKRLYFFLFCMMAAGITALGQDKVIKDPHVEKRSVSGFNVIKVEDGIDLYLTQDENEGLAVSANKPEYLEKIKTTVENGQLRIYYDASNLSFNWRGRQLKAYISVRTVRQLIASGGSDVFIQNSLKVPDLLLRVSGGADFHGTVTADNIDLGASGGSDIWIKGTVVNLKISASGGSDIHGYDLIAENAFVSASGGSDAKITATKELGVQASGGSDIDYRGNAVVKYKSSSGGSSVSKRN